MSRPESVQTLQAFSANGSTSTRFIRCRRWPRPGFAVARLPVSIRLVLESLLRNCDGKRVTEEAVRSLASWKAKAPRTEEIPFVVARIVLQDFTGVPLLVDLAAMRSAVAKMGKNPKIIEPLVPVDLVVDHSVQVDFSGSAEALRKNLEMEFSRNRERYQFLKWGMQAFETFKVVPPGIGIVHQVNLEYLAKGVLSDKSGVCYPDTLVGTDSHTTMINGLGIVGWGVGGIEAEAGMLGQPVYFLTPDVVGVHLTGALREGVTATDLALTLTQQLRKAKVVGKFVEFYGAGAAALPVVDRATIANMAPEYGATMGFFPIDAECSRYLRATGRTEEAIQLYEAYYKAQGLWGIPAKGAIEYSQDLALDLATVVPSVAGPKRPQDRIELPKLKRRVQRRLFPSGDRKRIRQAGRRAGQERPHRGQRPRGVPSRRRQPGGMPAHRAAARAQSQHRAGDGQQPADARSSWAGRRSPHGRRHRPRKRAHRGDHQLHQHLQSVRDAGGGPAGQEGGRARPYGQSRGQVLAGPGFPGGGRLSGQRPAFSPTSTNWDSRRSATAAPLASAIPARSIRRSRRRSRRTISSPPRCFRATAISRPGCTRASRPTS